MAYYQGICKEKGLTVGEDDAFLYALCRVLCSPEEQDDFVEWYYSGNWIKIEEEEEYEN